MHYSPTGSGVGTRPLHCQATAQFCMRGELGVNPTAARPADRPDLHNAAQTRPTQRPRRQDAPGAEPREGCQLPRAFKRPGPRGRRSPSRRVPGEERWSHERCRFGLRPPHAAPRRAAGNRWGGARSVASSGRRCGRVPAPAFGTVRAAVRSPRLPERSPWAGARPPAWGCLPPPGDAQGRRPGVPWGFRELLRPAAPLCSPGGSAPSQASRWGAALREGGR